MSGVVIIGAGECGVRAAFTLREEGYRGAITLVSGEDALPYERPPLSKQRPLQVRPIRPAESYADARIDLRRGVMVERVLPGEHRVLFGDGSGLGYERLLIATGARARLLPALDGCLTLRTLADAEAIVPRLVAGTRLGVIGGGFIGLELAATARTAGAAVTVIESADHLMARAVPQPIAARVAKRHVAEGVDVLTGVQVRSADATSVTLANGALLEFDLVVAGVGAVPDTLLAEAAGIAVDDGILVDRRCRTSASAIFAAGDCCRFPWRDGSIRLESWRMAQDLGAHAARAMLAADAAFDVQPWFWSDQYDLTLQVAGLFDPAGEIVLRDLPDEACLAFQQDGSGRLIAAAGVGRGNAIARDIKLAERLIGAGVVVPGEALADPGAALKRLLTAA